MAEDSVAQDQLRAFIERIERMEEEKAAIAADIREIYAEAKGNGFDCKVLREVIKLRKKDYSERAEFEAILELYMSALGMSFGPRDDDPPSGGGSRGNGRPATLNVSGQSSVTSTTPNASVPAGFDPETGEEVTTPFFAENAKNSEPQPPQPAAQMGAANEDAALPSSRGLAPSLAGVEAIADRQPIQEPQPPVAQAAPVDRCLTSATELEVAESSETNSTAARKDVPGTDGMAGVSPAPGLTLADVSDDVAPARDQAEPGAGDQAPPVDTNSNSVDTGPPSPLTEGKGDLAHVALPENPEREAATDAGKPGPVSAGPALATIAEVNRARPSICQNPDQCHSSSWRVACFGCRKAAEGQAA